MKKVIVLLIAFFCSSSFALDELKSQNEAVLKIAEKFYVDGFNGVVHDYSEYYSKDYHSSGWIKMFGSAEKLAKKNEEIAKGQLKCEQFFLKRLATRITFLTNR